MATKAKTISKEAEDRPRHKKYIGKALASFSSCFSACPSGTPP